MEHISDLLNHLQQAVARGEPHPALALKVQNIRAELERVDRTKKAPPDNTSGAS